MEEQLPGWVAARIAELEATVASQQAVIEQLRGLVAEVQADNERLRARVAELEARARRDSRTSSKPPSSDGLRKPPRPAQPRQPGTREQGKQPGSPGATLAQVAAPDEVASHVPARCVGCGDGLAGTPVVKVTARQVFDLPEVRLRVVEHRAEQRRCECGRVTSATFPGGVGAPVQYGPGVRALGCYLLVEQHLSVDRAAQLLSDVLGVPISTGTLAGLTEQAAQELDGFAETVTGQLRDAKVVHADETGLRVQGRLHWVHSASTPELTWQTVHAKRGRVGMDDAGVLPQFGGVLVHDDWAPYRCYPAQHALCGAYLLRELAWVAERPGQGWAAGMAELLVDALRLTDRARASGQHALDDDVRAGLHDRYQRLLDQGVHANPAAGLPAAKRRRVRRPPATRLLARLIKHRGEVLRFVDDLRVPFTNNQVERDLRMLKVHQKISGCWRTLTGARAFLTVRSYTSTARKHGRDPLTTLRALFAGRPWLPAFADG